jgi:hypothetical protein
MHPNLFIWRLATTDAHDMEAAKGDTTTRETIVAEQGSYEDQQELGPGQERTTEETRHASDSSTLELEQSASIEQENKPAASWKKGTPLQHDWELYTTTVREDLRLQTPARYAFEYLSKERRARRPECNMGRTKNRNSFDKDKDAS